jgi:AcrR family transcriptional regulator
MRVRAHTGRSRNDAARDAILQAAATLLAEESSAKITVDAIAKRANAGKQTIYRWWPSKFDILMDTFLEDAAGALEIPDTGTVAGDLRRHLRQVATFLSAEPAGRVMLALIGQAQHDPEVARTFQRRYLDERRALDRTILERGVARGDLPGDTDLDLVIDMIYGPVYHRVLLTGLPVDEQFIDGLVGNVMAAIAAP